MPVDIKRQIEHVIQSTLDNYLQAHGSPYPDVGGAQRSQGVSAVESHSLENLDSLLRDLEGRASCIVAEGHRVNALKHGPMALNHKDERTQFDSGFNPPTPAVPNFSVLSGRQEGFRIDDLELTEALLQSVGNFCNSLHRLVRTVM